MVNNYKGIIFDDYINREKYIGSGDEGCIYEYNNYAIKILNFCKKEELNNNLDKIKLMCNLKDESFAFPIGLMSTPYGLDGYYTKLVKSDGEFINLHSASYYSPKNQLVEYLVKNSNTMDRIHKKGVTIGDIK